MLSRMGFSFGNNIAYVTTPSTILGACKLLLKESALKNGFPNIEAESTTRKHDGEIVGTSTMFDAKCILASDYTNLQYDGAKKDGTSYLSIGASTLVVDKSDPTKGPPLRHICTPMALTYIVWPPLQHIRTSRAITYTTTHLTSHYLHSYNVLH
jgi:hypothetical protein